MALEIGRAEHGVMVSNLPERFDHVEKRFDHVDRLFEQIDERFEQIDRRFEGVDLRFLGIEGRLTALDQKLDQKVDQTRLGLEQRIDQMRLTFDGRFAELGGEIRGLRRDGVVQFRWTIGLMFGGLVALVGAFMRVGAP